MKTRRFTRTTFAKQKVRGFTLIELLVVIAIIGLLSSIVFASLGGARAKGRDARRIVDLREIAKAIVLYADTNGSYPSAACVWSSWACWNTFIGSAYISPTPKDPHNTDLGGCESVPNCHIYRYCALTSGFALAVNLERPFSSPMANHATCATGGPNYYWLEVSGS